MESKNKIITQTLSLNPVFNLNEYYGDGENFEFEKDVIYIDNRESEDTLTIFREYIQDNTIKFKDGKHKGSNKHFNGYCRLKLTGNRVLEYKTWRKEKLPVGDFMFNGIVFELKRGSDLFDSINGEIKRLDVQIDNAKKLLRLGIIKEYQIFCTLEGYVKSEEKFFNDFNYFSSQEGINNSIYYGMDYCIKAMFNVWSSSTRLNDRILNHVPELNPAVGMLYYLNNCTPAKAKAIYNEFHPFYIEDLEELTEKKLMKISGIGPITAKKIYNELQAILYRPNPSHKFLCYGDVNVF